MKEATSQILEQIKIVIFIYMIICVVQMFSLGTAPMELLKASLVSFAMVVLAITAKNFVKHPNLPGFAWATLISFVLTLPVSPLSDFIVGTVGKFNFSLVGLPLLAFAGISVGTAWSSQEAQLENRIDFLPGYGIHLLGFCFDFTGSYELKWYNLT